MWTIPLRSPALSKYSCDGIDLWGYTYDGAFLIRYCWTLLTCKVFDCSKDLFFCCCVHLNEVFRYFFWYGPSQKTKEPNAERKLRWQHWLNVVWLVWTIPLRSPALSKYSCEEIQLCTYACHNAVSAAYSWMSPTCKGFYCSKDLWFYCWVLLNQVFEPFFLFSTQRKWRRQIPKGNYIDNIHVVLLKWCE
jgi:hypothetical protein